MSFLPVSWGLLCSSVGGGGLTKLADAVLTLSDFPEYIDCTVVLTSSVAASSVKIVGISII